MSSYLSLKRLEMNSTIQDALEMRFTLSLKLYNEVRKNRNLLGYLIDVTTCHLAKQELSFTGHNENSD